MAIKELPFLASASPIPKRRLVPHLPLGSPVPRLQVGDGLKPCSSEQASESHPVSLAMGEVVQRAGWLFSCARLCYGGMTPVLFLPLAAWRCPTPSRKRQRIEEVPP